MYYLNKQKQIIDEIGLEDFMDFSERVITENKDSLIALGHIGFDEEDLLRGTGRTTQMLVNALCICETEPLILLGYDINYGKMLGRRLNYLASLCNIEIKDCETSSYQLFLGNLRRGGYKHKRDVICFVDHYCFQYQSSSL